MNSQNANRFGTQFARMAEPKPAMPAITFRIWHTTLQEKGDLDERHLLDRF